MTDISKKLTALVSRTIEFATFSAKNINGILTGNINQTLEPEDASAFNEEMQAISSQFAEIFSECSEGGKPDSYTQGMIFQYFFDKSVEIGFKMHGGMDVDTEFQPAEVLQEHYPDLPEYIQIKINGMIPRIVAIYAEINGYMKTEGIYDIPARQWLAALCMAGAILGMRFFYEMDLEECSYDEI